jgi:tetratricopeptide (TPR) repeat protein
MFAAPCEAACQLIKYADLPVTMQGLRATIVAKVNGQEAKFVVDTGAFFSSMTKASAARLGLPVGPPPFGMGYLRGVGHGEAEYDVAHVKVLTLGGNNYPGVDFIVLEKGADADTVGLLGENFFEKSDIEYDFANGAIRAFVPKDCGFSPLAYWATDVAYSVIPIEPVTPLQAQVQGEVILNGARIKATFDSGAPVSIMSTRAAAWAGVKTTSPGVLSAGVTSGVAQRSYLATWKGTFASLKIGGEELKNFQLRFGDIDLADGSEMLIGADFFLSHRILVSNSQHRMYFTYNGGPVFNLDRPLPPVEPGAEPEQETAAGTADAPRTADDFARRAAALMSTRDFSAAISDWTQAITLAPAEARYPLQRALAEMGNRQPLLAMADLDQAVKLDPEGVEARLARGELYFAEREPDKGKADLDAAAALAAKDGDERLAVAMAYGRVGLDEQAIDQLGPWLASHPIDDRRANALNERCWLSALLNTNLAQALIDCDAALKLLPGDPGILDSRGLTYLRLGELDRALSDYNDALRFRQNSAWTLYGRGLVELRKGMAKEGQGDIAAALAIRPALLDTARKYGLTPP